MRILFLSDNFWPETNAPATRLYEHATRWRAAGHHVTVITGAPNFPEGRVLDGYQNRWYFVEEVQGVRVVRVKTYITANEGFFKRTLDYVSFMVSGLIAGLFQRSPDLVVATSPQFFCVVAGWLLSRVKRRPFVFELRDLWPATIVAVGAIKSDTVVRSLERLELFLYRRADVIVSLTEAFRTDLISRGIEGDKIVVVPNGVDLSRFRPAATKDAELVAQLGLAEKFVVGYLGTHGLCQGLEKVVAAAELLEDNKGIAFLFAGAGAEREMIRKSVEARALSNVRLLPMQPKDRMPALWSICNVALIPLRDEPVFRTVIPSKLFEAMGMGVPVLMALPDGEATQIVCRYGVGLTVPPEDPSALARAILRLRGDEELLADLRRNCLREVEAFSRDRFAEDMLGAFKAVTRRERRA